VSGVSHPTPSANDLMLPDQGDIAEVPTTGGQASTEIAPSVVDPLRRRVIAAIWEHRTDLSAVALYTILAVWMLSHLWINPNDRRLANNLGDPSLFQWFLAHAAKSVTHFDNPLFSTDLHAPLGVNILANASVLLPALVLTPITLVLGPTVSFLVLLTVNLTATATAWYWLLSREIVRSRAAAIVGAAFIGFAPAMTGHTNGHPQVTAQFLVPLMLQAVIRMRTDRPVRQGVCLGLLVIAQFFTSLEILLLAIAACAAFVTAYGLFHLDQVRSAVPRLVRGLATAVAVAVPVLAYPLWYFFNGPRTFSGPVWSADFHEADLASYFLAAPSTLFGSHDLLYGVRDEPTETSTFFGPLLCLLVIAALVVGSRLARAIALTAVVFFAMSIGPSPRAFRVDLGVPGPWRLVGQLPAIDATIPVRWAVPIVAMIGVLLALAIDRAQRFSPRWRTAAWVATALALLPVVPAPLPALLYQRPVPRFITSGEWHNCLAPGLTLVSVPLPNYFDPDGMRWAAATGLAFPIALGLGIVPDDKGRPTVEHMPPTGALLRNIAKGRRTTPVDEAARINARVDLTAWRAGCVVLGDHPRQRQLLDTMTALLGTPPTRVDDVWVWSSPTGTW
jgi:hypothetical protein